jgi:hypothetical protein
VQEELAALYHFPTANLVNPSVKECQSWLIARYLF